MAEVLVFCSEIATMSSYDVVNRYMQAILWICIEMSPEQCKMARAGLGFGIRDLAEQAKVSTNTVTRFEAGEPLKSRTVDAIRRALEAAGVEFIAENGGGAGVRLRKE